MHNGAQWQTLTENRMTDGNMNTPLFTDLMVDIEAIGPSPNGVIVQIGALPFNIETGEMLDIEQGFNVNIKIDDQLSLGRIVNESTLRWWFGQSKQAQDTVFGTKHNASLAGTLQALYINVKEWCKSDAKIWSHSTYDFVMLMEAYRNVEMRPPWSYRDSVDIRTITSMYMWKTGKKTVEIGNFAGTQHNALDDCVNQIKYCSKMMEEMR